MATKRNLSLTTKGGGLAAALVAGILLNGRAEAETEKFLNAILSVREAYQSNVLFTVEDPQEDFLTVIGPRIESSLSGDRLNGDASLAVEREIFADKGELDATNQLHSIAGSLQLTPGLSLGADASFHEDHGIQRELTETGVAVDRRRRRTWNVEPSLTIQLGERTTLTPSGALSWAEYKDPRLSDFHTQGGTVRIEHELLDGKTTFAAEAGGASWNFEPRSLFSAQSRISLERAFSDTFTAEVAVGYRYLRRDNSPSQGKHNVEAGLRLFQDAEPLFWEILATRGMVTSPVGAAVNQNRAHLTAGYHPLEPLVLYVLGRVVDSDSRIPEDAVDSTVLDGTTGAAWLLSRHFVLQLSYRYTHLFQHIRNNETRTHEVTVSLRLQTAPIEDLVAIPFEGVRYGIQDL